MGVWGFNPHYLTGIYFFNLPIEEVLFFFFIPYCSVFVYFSIGYLIPKNPLQKSQRRITLILALVLLVIGVFCWDRWYTSVTFFLCFVYLFYNYFKRNDLSQIYFSYCFTLFFFFIVNGILTGSCIESPVVWYNDAENLGIRLGTIPVEDVFYGFLMIAAIIQLFEFFNSKSVKL
jgi:lycopene cyclase domain-containing protein